MGTKRLGWARIKSLINENVGGGGGNHRNWVSHASGSTNAQLPTGGTTAATTDAIQTNTVLIVGKNSVSTAKPAVADPFTESSTQLWPLGTELKYGDRTFRYAQMDGAVTAGKLLQQAIHVAHHTNNTITNADAVAGSYSHAAGSTTISLDTAGDTDLTADQYAEGYLIFNDATGEGQMLRIKSHPAHNHGDDPSVVITTYDPLKTTIVKNSSQCSLVKNPYKDVLIAPVGDETGAVVGATVIDMTDDYFGWVQTNGPAAVFADETLVIGHAAHRSDTTAGTCMPKGADDVTVQIGQVMASGVVDTEYAMIMLNLM